MKSDCTSAVDQRSEWMEPQYGEYLPTPSEIAEACREIRARWSPREQRQRCVGRRPGLRRHLIHMPRALRLELV